MSGSAAGLPPAVVAAVAAATACEQPAFISVLSPGQLDALAAAAGDGPLAGLPFAVKDNIDIAGVPTTAADPAVTEPAAASATVVERLIAAGAIPVGKTNMDQYATGLVGVRSPFGACHSVFSARHVSGGSSSGSAIAVATGVVPFALGTDTAGSGRVPAAFNGLVGMKGTKGLISTAGVFPACRTLDCVTVFAKTVALTRQVFSVLAAFDPQDPYSRPAGTPVRLRAARPVLGIPDSDLGLDEAHQQAWEAALGHAAAIADLVPVDVRPFLEVADLLYSGPWLAERLWAFGARLADGHSGADPTVRTLVAAGTEITGEQVFAGMYTLAALTRQTEPEWLKMDALLLPTTPTHPTLADLQAEPVAANSRLGRFTNMVNLLDLAAIAVPAGMRPDGLPFGVQLLGPAFSDNLLLDLGSTWLGESVPQPAVERSDSAQPAIAQSAVAQPGIAQPVGPPATLALAVAGAHLSGQPLNRQLLERGATLARTTTMASGYRMFLVDGPLPRPGVTRVPGGSVESALEVEVWNLPTGKLGSFLAGVAAPLAIGPVELADGDTVLGFVCSADGVDPTREITGFGGWRAYLSKS